MYCMHYVNLILKDKLLNISQVSRARGTLKKKEKISFKKRKYSIQGLIYPRFLELGQQLDVSADTSLIHDTFL